MSLYYGKNHKVYHIGKRIAGGGEGDVFEVEQHPSICAKIFRADKKSPGGMAILEQKVLFMIANPVTASNGILTAAWPTDALYSENGMFMGYAMPFSEGKPILAVTREREREQLFHGYHYRKACMIARNLALALKYIHDAGYIVGDMNPNNILVSSNGYVTLIDSDSFTVGSFYCSVGRKDYLAPELLMVGDLNGNGRLFTKESDYFSLAIHIFQLLTNRHPFEKTGENGDIRTNILVGDCKYIKGGKKTPDNAPDFKMLPPELRGLFSRVFDYSKANAALPQTLKNRPSAAEWLKAMNATVAKLDQSQCKIKQNHKDLFAIHACPICRLSNDAPVRSNPAPARSNPAPVRSHVNRGAVTPSGRPSVHPNKPSGPNQTGPTQTHGTNIPTGTQSVNQQTGISQKAGRKTWLLWSFYILMGYLSQIIIEPNLTDYSTVSGFENTPQLVFFTGMLVAVVLALCLQKQYRKTKIPLFYLIAGFFSVPTITYWLWK